MSNPVGLYVHVPFCVRKCPYCDFYSVPAAEEWMDCYTAAVKREIKKFAEQCSVSADTVYFGGGTPSVLGEARLTSILDALASAFSVISGAEITLEVNPGDDLRALLQGIRHAGWNRLSIGMQSANDTELRLLGRRHTAAQAAAAAEEAARAGFSNLSLDLMLAVPGQTPESLRRSLAEYACLGASHVSAYLLKIEEGTPYSRCADSLGLPDEEKTADLYLLTCEELERYGFRQYEISNFAKKGRESRHNLKYWRDEPYLGFGPSAHSFFGGKRFFQPRSLQEYCLGDRLPVPDGSGGSFEEYAMLALRLCEGLRRTGCTARFGAEGAECFQRIFCRALRYSRAGMTICEPDRVRLTRKGFLVSNALLAELLAE